VESVAYALSNLNTTATGPFDLPLRIDSLGLSKTINANFTNVEFSYVNGTLIPAWIESNPSNRSPSTLVWLNLSSIPALAEVTVDMLIFPESAFLLSRDGPIGEAPELSGSFGLTSSYARWDDGSRVFPVYANFSGSALPPGWSASPSISYNVSNGLQITADGGNDYQGIRTNQSFSAPHVLDFYGELEATGGVAILGFSSPSGPAGCSNIADCRVAVSADSRSTPDDIYAMACTSYGCSVTPSYSKGWSGNATWTVGWNASQSFFEENYTDLEQVRADIPTEALFATVWSTANSPLSTTENAFLSWARVRSLPTSGYFPAVTAGGLPSAPSGLQIEATGNTTLYLAWSNPTNTPLVNDTVLYGTTCAALTGERSTGGASQATLLTGLAPNTTYCAEVVAWNAFGPSVPSSSVTGTTLGGARPALPEAPTGLVGLALSEGSIYLQWTNPLGVLLVNDTVYWAASCSALAGTYSTFGAAQGWLVTGLSENATYCFAVAAWDSAGEGPYSAEVRVTTEPAPFPAIEGFVASPSVVPVGNTTVFTITMSATSGPIVAFSYANLPSGCEAPKNATSWSCVPSVAGTFDVEVTASDANGHRATASTTLVVHAPSHGPNSSPNGSTGSSASGLPLSALDLGLIGVVVALAAALGVVLFRSSRRPPPPPT
jgi:hypothetical protein